MAQLDLETVIRRARVAGGETAMVARLTRDLPGWLRDTRTPEDARARLRQRLLTREQRFPILVERAVYDNPRSPYLQLLRHAGCERGDFKALIAREGIEGGLRILADRGVYVTFDEFKGRREAVRGSARFTFEQQDFNSPLVKPHYVTYTSGTGGRPGVVMRSLPFLDELACDNGANFDAHGLSNGRRLFWMTNPITQMLITMKLRGEMVGWLHPVDPLPRQGRVAGAALALLGRPFGHRLPRPRFLDAGRPDRMAALLHRRPRDGRPLIVSTVPSAAVRVAMAAQEASIDLAGVTFHLTGEPLTAARHQHITRSGARVYASYAAIELSAIAYSCAAAETADDLHLLTNRVAVVERERSLTADGPTVSALLISTITEHAPKICLNTELGDHARVERRACGCAHGELGLTTHLSEIRSFEKLSSEGVSFARSNLVQILEEVLPARFGGTSLDYQLVEEEAPDSSTRLVLRVSPAAGPIDQDAIRTAFLAELGRGGITDRHQAELLRRVGSVVIERRPPLPTAAGKVLPFNLLHGPTTSDTPPR